jgi:hypothetical protein
MAPGEIVLQLVERGLVPLQRFRFPLLCVLILEVGTHGLLDRQTHSREGTGLMGTAMGKSDKGFLASHLVWTERIVGTGIRWWVWERDVLIPDGGLMRGGPSCFWLLGERTCWRV